MESVFWGSLLSLIIKRRIDFVFRKWLERVNNVYDNEKYARLVFPLIESIVNNSLSILRKVWTSIIEFLSKYAKGASPDRDKKRGRLQYGLHVVTS